MPLFHATFRSIEDEEDQLHFIVEGETIIDATIKAGDHLDDFNRRMLESFPKDFAVAKLVTIHEAPFDFYSEKWMDGHIEKSKRWEKEQRERD